MWPYTRTGSPDPPLSMRSSGVRPGSSMISVCSAASWSCTHSRSSRAAAAMAPRSAQSGSYAGERQGIRVYSHRAGRTLSSHAASIIGPTPEPVPLMLR